MTARSGRRSQGLDSHLVTEALESTNTTADGTLGLASIEVSRTEFLVGSGASNERVRNDQDFVSDSHHRPLVAALLEPQYRECQRRRDPWSEQT